MDIKSLVQDKRILLTIGGVLVVMVIMGAVYLPGTLFRGALTTSDSLTTVSPTLIQPISTIEPIDTTLLDVSMEDGTTQTVAAPQDATTDTSEETLDSTTLAGFSGGTLQDATYSVAEETESQFTSPISGIYSTTTTTDTDFELSSELRSVAEPESSYTLTCRAVSLAGTQDFRAEQELQWLAEISPAGDQEIIYNWSERVATGLLETTGNPVRALYNEPGTYYVSVTATPIQTAAMMNVDPLNYEISQRCSVEILEAETIALPTGGLRTIDSSPFYSVVTETETSTITETRTVTEPEEESAAVPTAETAAAPETEPVPTAELAETAAAPETEPVPTATISTAPVSQCGIPYPDDIAGHWAEAYIKKGYDECLFRGINGKFHPDWEIYRIEAASMLLYALGMQPDPGCYNVGCGTPFADLTSIEEGAIVRPLFINGLIEGYGRVIFKPRGFLTRAEASAMIVKSFFEPHKGCYTPNCGAGHPNNLFNDIYDMWQGQYIRVLWDRGIVTGAGPNRVEPNNFITRAEMAKMIVMAHEQTK